MTCNTGVLMYIDPGTGSMLFSVFVGIAAAVVFFIQKIVLKAKFLVKGGKSREKNINRVQYLIFSDNKWYWNIFKPICDEFERRGIYLEYWTASKADPALNEKYENVKCVFIGEGNKAFGKLNFANAEIVLSTTPGLGVYQWKRSNNVSWYVHTFHSTGDSALYRMFGLDFYDAVLLSGKVQEKNIRNMEKIRPHIKQKELTYVGSAYMDVMKERLDKAKQNEGENITVLVASSWGKSSVLSNMGKELIRALIDTGYNIVIRPHPQSFVSEVSLIEDLQSDFPEGNNLSWNRDNDNFDILNKADIMITDFSSVIFDYALIFDKPVLYADTSFDLSPYDAWWLDREGLYDFDAHRRLGQKLVKEELGNIKDTIDDLLKDDPLKEGRNDVRRERWVMQGEAAVRTVDYLVKKSAELNAE
ncbi:MAG: CDP-glycerol glycerophosphotransferase family protein [Lachnospiraceae bacterium]|nr:CDP-glycerol glycerophosphotransferase family protein [Lachnospiraceae bacterium]